MRDTVSCAVSDGRPSATNVADAPTERPSRADATAGWRDRIAARPDRWFLVVAIVAGLGLAVALPPLGGYDELTHLERVWQLSDGHFTPKVVGQGDTEQIGDDLPCGLGPAATDLFLAWSPKNYLQMLGVPGAADRERGYSAVWHRLDAPAPKGPPTFYEFSQAVVYSPVVYFPAIVTLRVTRAFGASLFLDILVARLALYAAYVALVWRAIRRTTVMPWVFALAGLAPVALVQAMTVSADAISHGLTILLVAEAIRLADPARITPAALRGVAAIAAGLAVSKAAYVGAVLMLVVAARRTHGTQRRALVAIMVGALAIAGAWSLYGRHYYAPVPNPFPGSRQISYAYHDVDPTAQLRRVVTHPWALPRAILGTIAFDGARIARDTVAKAPSWLPPLWEPMLVVAALLAAAAAAPSRRRRGTRERAWIGLVTLAIAAALLFLAYIGWNAVGAPRIDAFQGRYFVALLAPAVVALWPASARIRAGARASTALVVAGAAEAVALAAFTIGLAHFFA